MKDMKKKILIVNNNLDAGGIQKSLINLLKASADDYEITLMLFSKSGVLLSEVPDHVRVITPRAAYRMLGLNRTELSAYPRLYLAKIVLVVIARLFGRRTAMRLLGLFQAPMKGYDAVISFSHLTGAKQFQNGCGDFVLDRVNAAKKLCWLHCDYGDSGFQSEKNDHQYCEFDRIVCVSESVRNRFAAVNPAAAKKTAVLRNFSDPDVIAMSRSNPVSYDPNRIHLLSVARLSPEKGLDRAAQALAACERSDLFWHIVGDGPERERLQAKCVSLGIDDRVEFCGEQINPYRFMAGVDYLLVPSVHEAAPLVFDEAHSLGVPIAATETLSAREMLFERDQICANSTEGLTQMLMLLRRPVRGVARIPNNDSGRAKLAALLNEETE